MFRPSANVGSLPARPSGWKSARILTRVARPVVPSAAGKGYSSVSVTQSRPRSSKAMLSGLWIRARRRRAGSRTPRAGGTRGVRRSASSVRNPPPAWVPARRTMPSPARGGSRGRVALVPPDASGFVSKGQYWSLLTTSPPATVPRARQAIPSMDDLMNLTLPSPNRVLTPPG